MAVHSKDITIVKLQQQLEEYVTKLREFYFIDEDDMWRTLPTDTKIRMSQLYDQCMGKK